MSIAITDPAWRFWDELLKSDREKIEHAHPYADTRYCWYRKKGYSMEESLAYTFTWAKNMHEQAERRRSHDTGYLPDYELADPYEWRR